MATTLRARRLIDAKRECENAKTLVGKIAALRELLSVHGVGRIYRRYATKKLIELRAEASGNDELLRRLASLDERLTVHAESEKSRLARKHAGQQNRPKKMLVTTTVKASLRPAKDLIKLWQGDNQ